MFFTRGTGKHRENLQSFEEALRVAGIASFNLVRVSSIYPPHCKIISREKGLAQLSAGDEFQVKSTRVIVVHKDDNIIVLRVNGKNVQYSVGNLPIGLAIAMADRWFDASAASTKIFKGAMMAVDPNFQIEDARRLWREAVSDGGVELHDLPRVLDDSYDLVPE